MARNCPTLFARMTLPCLMAVAALAGCGLGTNKPEQRADDDPALAAALSGPILTDLDLVQQDLSHVAIAGGGPPVIQLPPVERDPDALAAIRDEAKKLAGPGLANVPTPQGAPESKLARALTLTQLLDAIPGKPGACPVPALPGLGWSLQLPVELPIYPRGHLTDAAGSEGTSCHRQAVTFLSPASAEEIAAFYAAMGRKAGHVVTRQASDTIQVVTGSKPGASFVVRASAAADTATTVDLATRQAADRP